MLFINEVSNLSTFSISILFLAPYCLATSTRRNEFEELFLKGQMLKVTI